MNTVQMEEDIRPPHSLVALKPNVQWDIVLFILFLLIVMVRQVIVYIKGSLARRRQTAYEKAMSRLGSILVEYEKCEDKDWVDHVSGCLREYVEKAYDLPAEGRTTEEFLLSLKSHMFFGSEKIEPLLEEFLNKCDRVKFAQEQLKELEKNELRERVKSLVQLAHTWLLEKTKEEKKK